MIYLLDANTLIDAKRDYYQFERVPEFWAWLEHQGHAGVIKIPIEIYEEFEESRKPDGSRDSLSEWAAQPEVRTALLLDEDVDPNNVNVVLENAYGPGLTDDEIDKVGRDPFLISYALCLGDCTIVSTEASKPGKKRANRRVPDVCQTLNVRCINNFDLINELNFSTGWNK